MSLRALNIGTYIQPTADDPYHPIATATMETAVHDVVHLFSEKGISAVPIIDENGVVINLYETVDVTVSNFFLFSLIFLQLIISPRPLFVPEITKNWTTQFNQH